ncbi:hypothetical protein FHX08_003884 [Rhizobium sp. BK529]|uniref:hypothetical protein n=1 Tax=Rhizobium sp. BK418 TaxID=2512120 RepID=UPI0010DF58A3|nr:MULTISPECIES: hypothetical protein [unclassified Rhizobium]MBB3593481.1 hypothetical protein [Rhizobium sp. BK529]TCS03272.1 hypothetical protein EV281_104355 [Rhizobium sp. BK418]
MATRPADGDVDRTIGDLQAPQAHLAQEGRQVRLVDAYLPCIENTPTGVTEKLTLMHAVQEHLELLIVETPRLVWKYPRLGSKRYQSEDDDHGKARCQVQAQWLGS